MTPWTLALNEVASGLERLLPATDTRLRPDIRALELGQYDKVGLGTLFWRCLHACSTRTPCARMQDQNICPCLLSEHCMDSGTPLRVVWKAA